MSEIWDKITGSFGKLKEKIKGVAAIQHLHLYCLMLRQYKAAANVVGPNVVAPNVVDPNVKNVTGLRKCVSARKTKFIRINVSKRI